MGTFASNRLADLAPFFRGPEGEAFAQALGEQQDDEMALLRVAALSRLPEWCPDDALDGVGAWLRIERFTGEGDASYRERLKIAWSTWTIAATAAAIMQSLQAYGIVDVAVYRNEDFGDNHERSTFVVVLGPDFGTTGIDEQVWGTFVWGDSSTWGSTATVAQRNAIIGQVLKWKAAQSVPIKIVLSFERHIGVGFIWGVSLWGGPDVWGDPDPCEWILANIWGETFTWGASAWGTGRWYEPDYGF